MKSYCIQFWYYTVCRAQEIVEAVSSIEALSVLMYTHPIYLNWTENGKGFYVMIELES